MRLPLASLSPKVVAVAVGVTQQVALDFDKGVTLHGTPRKAFVSAGSGSSTYNRIITALWQSASGFCVWVEFQVLVLAEAVGVGHGRLVGGFFHWERRAPATSRPTDAVTFVSTSVRLAARVVDSAAHQPQRFQRGLVNGERDLVAGILTQLITKRPNRTRSVDHLRRCSREPQKRIKTLLRVPPYFH